jgi:N-acetylneuraminate synthase
MKNRLKSPVGEYILGKDGVFIVAEIGINHNGCLNLAKILIDIAAEAGCNAVKFQKRDPEIHCGSKANTPYESPWGNRLIDKYRGREFDFGECCELLDYALSKGIYCFWSVWDKESVKTLNPLFKNCGIIKIPSARLRDTDLLKEIDIAARYYNQAVFVGTGMGTMDDVKAAHGIFGYDKPVVYMQCTSSYPCKPEDIHLNVMAGWMAQAFKVGYSGHEVGFYPTLAAVAMGAMVIERHITLDKTLTGSDQHMSLEPDELTEMVKAIREIEQSRGNLMKFVLPCEEDAISRLT